MILNVTRTEVPDGPLSTFGPQVEDPAPRLQIPVAFQRAVTLDDPPFELVVSFRFEGDRIELNRLAIEGERITPRDLGRLGLPAIVRAAGIDAIPDGDQWTVFVESAKALEDARRSGPSDATLLEVAQYYWFDHVTWGSPRSTIMTFWDISRTTANDWIRKASKLFPMPGQHARSVPDAE